MSISSSANSARLHFTATSGQTAFSVSFEFFDDADLDVYVNGTQKTITTDYTVSGGDGSTGTVTFNSGLVLNDAVTITRRIDIERVTDFSAGQAINRAALNTQLDTLTAIASDNKDRSERALRAPDDENAPTMTLPSLASRKGTVLGFNLTTGAVEAGPQISDVSTLSAISADIATLADIEDGTDATDAIQNVNAIRTDVTTVAGINTTHLSNVSSVATEIATVAGISSDVTAVAGDATDIGTVATNIASVNTAATNIVDIQNASTNAATATTKAAEAATSATNAATSETNAATSATNAATSASAAAASQTAAAASAASAASAFDNFDDTYLGSKTSDPTTDNDGDPLNAGDLYFNSTANEMRVYDGANWIAATSAGNVSLLNYNYTATSGQTTFSGADDNAATLSYTQQNLIVTLNGITLEDGTDYTANNGTSIVLASGAATGDELNIVAFKSFTTADMVPASTGGTFSGNVTFSGAATVNGAFTSQGIDDNATSTAMTLDGSGNVGIGTTSPSAIATIKTASNEEDAILIEQSDGTDVGSLRINNGAFIIKGKNASQPIQLQTHDGNEDIEVDPDGFIKMETAGSERLRIDSSGNLLVGTTSASPNPGVVLQPVGNVGIGNSNGNSGASFLEFRRNATQIGGVTQSGTTGVSYNTSSDHRLKENVTDVTDGITRVKQLEPKRFNFIVDPDRTVDGFLAHEVQLVIPEAVTGTHNEVDDDGNAVMQGIDQSKLVPLLTAALKESIAKIETLETEMTSVKARLDALEGN